MVAGAKSVASYLDNTNDDRLLAVLPLSFDYGFSQLSTAFVVGASVALMDYLLPRDVLRAAERFHVTGLAAVPPLWIQLAALEWPESVRNQLRYITNSGGAMPVDTLQNLRRKLPKTSVFLMYGLTEAFRSTYLPPDQADVRPTSIGKAIPNVEVLVIRPDGTECAANEPGELVHRGPLVALGYWGDADRTAQRFRPSPVASADIPIKEIAVWSGDTVVRDEDGYLYFVGRRDEMIKTSGYRVSPTEVEEIVHQSGLVSETVALGAPHPSLGQVVVVIAVSIDSHPESTEELLAYCRSQMPNYMVPAHVVWRDSMPRNANGKIDRSLLADHYRSAFEDVNRE
jgi:acyl-CoA ligase (AMP-forming) (exosortase A-associated)